MNVNAVLPATQNRSGTLATGYYKFVPGVPLATSGANSSTFTSRAFTGEGWVVNAPGGVSFPTETWTFRTDLKVSGTAGTAYLDIGMWLVTSSGIVVSQLIDPTCSSVSNARARPRLIRSASPDSRFLPATACTSSTGVTRR